MNDPFEILELPHGLAISSEKIDEAYRDASRRLHPDSGGEEDDFQEMAEAAELLKSPSRRLRWAIESTESVWDSRGNVPRSVMDLFLPVAEAIQKIDQFELERGNAKSALGRAVLDARVPELKRELEDVLQRVSDEEAGLLEAFEDFDRRGWLEVAEQMGEVARGLSFLEKWQREIRAATGKLFQALLGGL